MIYRNFLGTCLRSGRLDVIAIKKLTIFVCSVLQHGRILAGTLRKHVEC